MSVSTLLIATNTIRVGALNKKFIFLSVENNLSCSSGKKLKAPVGFFGNE